MKSIISKFVILFASLTGLHTSQALASSVNDSSLLSDVEPVAHLETSSKPTQTNNQLQIGYILAELEKNHSSASALVKQVRNSAPLAIQSDLIDLNSTALVSKDADMLEKLTAVASNAVNKFKQTGLASWYGRQFHGRKTANGETFDMNAFTAAHKTLPMSCYIKVTNKDNGKSVVVKVNDRGPFHGNRVLDLSYAAAKAIGLESKGVGNVVIERVQDPK